MPLEQDAQPRRPTYEARSRVPSGLSPSSLSAQSEANKASSGQATASSSPQAKLDGVLYHFYTTTANLILQSRLIRYRNQFLSSFADAISEAPPADPSAPCKVSKWFALQIPDNDLFKEELRFWRSVTSLLEAHAEGAQASDQVDSVVPDMVIDVILDLSEVPDHHITLLRPSANLSKTAGVFPGMAAQDASSKERIALNGKGSMATEQNAVQVNPKLVVLEQWRLHFRPSSQDASVDLPTLYKRSIIHFRALFSLLLALPSNRLCARLEDLHKLAASNTPNKAGTLPSHPSFMASMGRDSRDHEMRIGCRLSMGNSTTEDERTTGEYRLQDPLRPEVDVQAADKAASHLAEKTLPPIMTPIGSIDMSVTFRSSADYFVEANGSSSGPQDIQVDVDEDYFKPTKGTPQHVPSSTEAARTAQYPFPTQTHQQIGGITAGRLSHASYGQLTPSRGLSAEIEKAPTIASQAATPHTVFSTSAQNKPVAGLSSLRSTGLSQSGSTFPVAAPSTAPHSPALAGALNSEPAFVTSGVVRRTSTSDRRLRSASGATSNTASPPLGSPSGTKLDLPEISSSLPKQASSAHPTTMANSPRTGLGRLGSATHSRPGGSFSPSSSSPLAPQMSLQSRSPSGNVPQITSRSAAGSRAGGSVSAYDSGLAAPSLRSVFQNYAARSLSSVQSSLPRAPPAVSSSVPVGSQGSYSPSGLGSVQRSTSIRRFSNTSEAGSGSAFAPSASTAAQPQMIKRYSTNFSYRQNRERQGVYGSSLGSEGSGFVGAGGEASSFPNTGMQSGSLSSAYGRSWISRMEQRQGLSSAYSNSLTRTASQEEGNRPATSSLNRFRSANTSGISPTGASPRSQDEEIGAFMRLLDSKAAFGSSSFGRLAGYRGDRRSVSALGSTPEESGHHPRLASGEENRVSPASSQPLFSGSRTSGSGTLRTSVYNSIRTAQPMSRSQIDEVLSRMAESVGMVSVGGKTATDMTRFSSSQSAHAAVEADVPSIRGKARPSVKGVFGDTDPGHSARDVGSAIETTAVTAIAPPRGNVISSQPSLFAGAGQVRGTHTSAVTADRFDGLARLDSARPDPVMQTENMEQASPAIGAEYEIEGELMFGVEQPHYDPEDDLPGKMDMVGEDEVAPTALHADGAIIGGARSSRRGVYSDLGIQRPVGESARDTGADGDSIEGGRGATLPAGAHRNGGHRVASGPVTDWHRAEQRERERALEAERRRADAELSRNFGQEVGASTRGRGSLSPWRAPGQVSSHTQAPRGDESLSRRGYGVSAPSTHFHYQHHSRQSSNSYPASKDDLHGLPADDEDEDEYNA